MDHVAIDRFTGGGVDQMKFDDYPLPGCPGQPLILEGKLWVKDDIDDESKSALEKAFADFRDGLVSLGGLGAIGYGQIGGFGFVGGEKSWLRLPSDEKRWTDVRCGDRFICKPDVSRGLESDKIYHPHYFLKPSDKEVYRERELVSHAKKEGPKGEPLFTGKITCRLTTEGPVFIPDTDLGEDYFGMQEAHKKHKNYGFFRINGNVAIPGSSIRGMISSVFEALTHSCFRVFDQERYLSRSAEPTPEELTKYLPGRVRKIDNKLFVSEMGDIFRLPLYDFEDVKSLNSAYDLKKYSGEDRMRYNKIKTAIEFNKEMAGFAEHNRNFLKKNYEDSEIIKILKGEKEVCFTAGHRPNSKHDNDNVVLLTKATTRRAQSGFIKFTGPNMVNIKADADDSDADVCDFNTETSLLDKWWDLNSLPFHNRIEDRPSQKKEYPRPVFKCIRDVVEYTMLKRCEHIFSEKKKYAEYPLSDKVRKQYNERLKDNRNNTEHISPFFRSRLLHEELSDGDLVYFKYEVKKRVTDIWPVRISRGVDDKPLGKRFQKSKRFPEGNESLRPCHHVCLEDCEGCPHICKDIEEYFSPHPDGLCPACHVFGTTHYKGRVSFGLAWPESDKPEWYISGDDAQKGGPLTFPLLERPRPTWSMPNKKSEIPGRKFYVHHPESVNKIKAEPVTPNENNRTVEPLANGNEFTFEVRFNNLRDWELGLLYSLELEGNMAHKLGMGKALGMGSVRIKAEAIELHCESAGQNAEPKDKAGFVRKGFEFLEIDKPGENDPMNFNHVRQLRELLWFPPENISANIRYPTLEKADGIPGYTNMIKEKTPNTGKDNPYYLPPIPRIETLQSLWKNWYPLPQFQSSEGNKASGSVSHPVPKPRKIRHFSEVAVI